MNFNDFYINKIQSDPELKKIINDKDRQFFYDVAHLITEARLHAGLTQEKLAIRLHTKQSSIARLERGANLPSLTFLHKIAKVLGTHLIAPRFGFMKDFRGSLNIRQSFVVSNLYDRRITDYSNFSETKSSAGNLSLPINQF